MVRSIQTRLCIFVVGFAALAVAKPPPSSASPWASYGKPVFARALGPPMSVVPGMGSITVPYKPKASPFFPKFVDPKTLIAKKTDLLSNLFGGLGPVDNTAGAASAGYSQYSAGVVPSKPVAYVSKIESETPAPNDIANEGVDAIANDQIKRAIFGPSDAIVGSPKISPFGPKFSPFAPNFSPFGPKFGPPSAGYPFASFPPKFGPGFFGSDTPIVRRRRSVVETAIGDTKVVGPPPAYPGLAPIAEEPETIESKLLKLYDPASAPKETLPGMFGPFGPYGPFVAPAVDPSAFISKKTTFLDTLFANLATTAAPIDSEDPSIAVTDVPVPKSTIVPPDFWAPSGIIPGPTEYTDKVSSFLDKLFQSVILNKTASVDDPAVKTVLARALVNEEPIHEKTVVARSLEDIKTIAAAKDSIVDTILSELGDLKADMISTLDDLITYEKTAPLAPGAKKPLKPSLKPSPFAAFFAKPTPDPTLPFKQRMTALSQVFDMLTGLQKNVTVAVQNAIASSITEDQASADSKKTADSVVSPVSNYPAANGYAIDSSAGKPKVDYTQIPSTLSVVNTTLLDAIKSRLESLEQSSGPVVDKSVVTSDIQGKIIARSLEKSPKSFWVAYPQADAAPAKRNIDDVDYEIPEYYSNHRDNNRDQLKRAVQMQMHQGYQYMPPGAIESVQAGGGSAPGHQGAGIKLLESQNNEEDWKKWSEWAEYWKNVGEGRRNHHNHH